MKKVILGIGIPGSGKTTLLKQFAEKNEYSYICPDDIRKELTGDPADQTRNKEVWDEAYRRLSSAISGDATVVFDATFANPEQRKDFLTFARDKGAEKIQGVFVDAPLEVAISRNENRERVVPEYVLSRMSQQLHETPPAIHEGIDALFTIDEHQKLLSLERPAKEPLPIS